jgi:hypothetical protein
MPWFARDGCTGLGMERLAQRVDVALLGERGQRVAGGLADLEQPNRGLVGDEDERRELPAGRSVQGIQGDNGGIASRCQR